MSFVFGRNGGQRAQIMAISATFSLFEQLSPLRLAGPLLDKELRVSSRRRRTYALRVGYVALMCLYALAAWCGIMMRPSPTTVLFGASRSARVGLQVAQSILWFQFLAAQLVAGVMLSSSMNDEMHRGGLGVLLTTPITSVQIVLGKLLSRLWQILLLMALSLPALAVVRVMGGISWALVVSSCAVTLTSALFVGALCLWLSTHCRYPYQVISAAAITYLIVFIALPGGVTLVASLARLNQWVAASITHLVSPRQAFIACLNQTWRMGPAGPKFFFSWPLHCLLMLGATLGLLGVCARRIRRAAGRVQGSVGTQARYRGPLRRCPIVWRERAACSARFEWGGLLLVIMAAVLCLLTVVARVKLGRGYQALSSVSDIAWAFWMIALLRLAVLAAGAIAREKEGRTWPLLLTTPLDDRRIVRSKLRVIVDRGVPWVLAAFAVQVCFVLCAGPWSWEGGRVVACCAVLYCASAFFVVTAGLYFGLRLKTTTTAIVATLGAHMFLRHVVGGHYNPLVIWLRYKIVMGLQANSNSLLVFAWGTLGGSRCCRWGSACSCCVAHDER